MAPRDQHRDTLRIRGRALHQADEKARKARDFLDEAIAGAYDAGVSMTDISRDSFISREAVRRALRRRGRALPATE